ncbi:hypothetical protein EUTSA_v10026695mg [Eutrema salsugineum]|uniref:Uncharacterized protein n=1 Tax=Eutrema salsugineum TaxID=72664 RepID=V4MB07_EUTSA|nr:hypothetical protein EUTSA_v10026695mg [Eutrema salsugineum]
MYLCINFSFRLNTKHIFCCQNFHFYFYGLYILLSKLNSLLHIIKQTKMNQKKKGFTLQQICQHPTLHLLLFFYKRDRFEPTGK